MKNQITALALILLISCSPSGPEDCMGNIDGDAVLDCAGICGGNAAEDFCGICNGSNNICSSFMLSDLNATSPTYGSLIGPSTHSNQLRLIYFSENET